VIDVFTHTKVGRQGLGRLFGFLLLVSVVALALGGAASTASGTGSARGRLVIGEPVTVPTRPVAGKRFRVAFAVTRSDTHKRVLQGKMICDPSIAGKVIRHTESFKRGTARLAFIVPLNAKDRVLKVKVTIKSGTQSARKVVTFRVEGVTLPSVSIDGATVTEGNSGTTMLSFPVALSAATTKTVSITYTTVDGTATAPADYAATSGTITFQPGETAKAIPVNVVGDTAIELDETFTVQISSPLNATIDNDVATGTITNDDTAVPITPGSYKGLLEGNALFFDVADRYVTNFRSNYVRQDCNSGGWYVYGQVNWGSSRFAIDPQGNFEASYTGAGTVSGEPATFHEEVTGHFEGTNAHGTVLGTVEWDHEGVHLTCTSGQRPWTATLQP
jgi:hypothetical protein